MYFPTTHWSLLAKATLNGESEARSALGELCRRYWSPLHQFIRARGYPEAEAQDLTQDFLLHLIDRSALRKPDPLRGKFRSFLLGALANFLSHELEQRMAAKRGGQHPHVSVDALKDTEEPREAVLPDKEAAAFDRNWALALIRAALDRVEQNYAAAGNSSLFGVLRAFLPGSATPPPYNEAAARAGLSVAAFNSEVHRLRRQFREYVYAEVTGTVSAPHEIEGELTHLYMVLLDRGTDFRAIDESDGGKTVSTR